jgi:hypothetical protein
VDLSELESPADFPDQSEELALRLRDASGLVVVSPYYLWTPAEIALVEDFVADGGRLLLISDPDVYGDVPWQIGSLGEPFGVVFNDDFLYDLSQNDGNFAHVFQDEFLDQAAVLDGKTVAFYGARSISGPVIGQVRAAETTLSSLRTGLSHFTTVAIGGRETNGTTGNVLAMGDFDVLTEPYVARHDNRALLHFVADFLADAQREQTLPDFPGYLGQQVGLVFGGEVAVDAQLLQQGGWLQQRLEQSGRVLALSNSTALARTTHLTGSEVPTASIASAATPAFPAATGEEPHDLIYLGTFRSADQETTLLGGVGIRLVEEVVEPEGTEISQAVPGEQAEGESVEQSAPVVGQKTEGNWFLETDSGLRFLAAETVLILQQDQDDGTRVIAVLGSDSQAIGTGLNRLLFNSFADCVNHVELSICPFIVEQGPDARPPDSGPVAPPGQPDSASVPDGSEGIAILVVDDNDQAAPDEPIEAIIYLQTLAEMGYPTDHWSTAEFGSPSINDLVGYDWVIWSSGAYEGSGPDDNEKGMLWDFTTTGGRVTISGRNHPLVGESPGQPSSILDVVKTDEVPDLVIGFPDEPIELPPGLPPVVPIQVEVEDYGPDVTLGIALRRGPNSAGASAPLLVALFSPHGTEALEVRATILGMSLSWLPDSYAPQLVQNMAFWMLMQEE